MFNIAGFVVITPSTNIYPAKSVMGNYCIALQFANVRGELEQQEYSRLTE